MKNLELIKGNSLLVMDDLIKKGVVVDALVTDPPYNLVGKIGSIHLFRQSEKDNTDNLTEENMKFDVGFDQVAWLEKVVKLIKSGGNLIIFNDWENMGTISKELKKFKIKVKSLNHWQKTNPQPAEWKRRFVPGREYFLHSIKQGKYTFNVEKLHKGVFEMGLTKQSEKSWGKHPNQKPVKLMEEIIEIISEENDVILDPFMGSGSTGVACKNLNRKFIGIEMDEKYYQLSKDRIEKSTNN